MATKRTRAKKSDDKDDKTGEKPKRRVTVQGLLKQGRVWLGELFESMELDVTTASKYDKDTKTLNYTLDGPDLGALLSRDGDAPATVGGIIKLLTEAIALGETKYTALIHADYEAPAPAAPEPEPAEHDERPAPKKERRAAKKPEVDAKPKPRVTAKGLLKQGGAWLSELFELMELHITARAAYDKGNKTLNFELEGEDRGRLLGRRGTSPVTVEGIEKLLGDVLEIEDTDYSIHVDVNGFRRRRQVALETLAAKLADKASDVERGFVVAGMNDFERRVVHRALTDDKRVRTESLGYGTFRKLRVDPS
ncbi:MAG: R3H domain-containing nucleic acid-binding protein [Myxococcota bacterium]